MTVSQIINQTLWHELRETINKAYAADQSEDGQCLRDYAQNVSWSDALVNLLDREVANEKQHRKGRPTVAGFGPYVAAKLILFNNIVTGAKMADCPRATAFLVLRQTAVEAEVIGWLIRKHLDPAWVKAVESYDYAKLMQAA